MAQQLILIPGLASNGVMWHAQVRALAPLYPDVHVSDVHFRAATITQMAQSLLDEHPDDLVLCGASMGGVIAMEAARLAPARIRGLALLGTIASPETPEIHALRAAAIELFLAGRADEVLRANVPLAFHASRIRDTALVQQYLDFVLAAGVDQLVRQNRAIMARPDARQHLAGVRCPVLLLCGDSDQLTPPAHSHEIARLLPGAQLHIVPQCGHMLTMEQPDRVNELLLQWLAQLPAAPAAD